MKRVHTRAWLQRRIVLAATVSLCAGFGFTPLQAAPYGPPGYAAECGLDIQRSADADAYYLEIGSGTAAAPQVAMQLRGRLLRLQVRQADDQRSASCHTRFYKSLTLPRDADVPRIQRRDEGGRVLIVIPRREYYRR